MVDCFALQVLGEDTATLKKTLHSLGIFLKPAMYKMDVRPLLKLVLTQFFGPPGGLVDMITQHIPNPVESAPHKIATTYSGPLSSDVARAMITCDREGPLMIQVTKLYPSEDAQEFHAFGRVMSGTVRSGQKVKVLGEGYSMEDEEDMVVATVEKVWVNESRSV